MKSKSGRKVIRGKKPLYIGRRILMSKEVRKVQAVLEKGVPLHNVGPKRKILSAYAPGPDTFYVLLSEGNWAGTRKETDASAIWGVVGGYNYSARAVVYDLVNLGLCTKDEAAEFDAWFCLVSQEGDLQTKFFELQEFAERHGFKLVRK